METLCMGCMQLKRSNPRCEHCGYDSRSTNNVHQLPVGTVVGGQYTLGRVLGQGGFGITYIGWDNMMQSRVAVKEYFPSGFAGRSGNSRTVASYDHQGRHDFEANKRRFLREAESLSRLRHVPQIVNVLRYFEENGTAYIAMEYVEGMDLRKYLKQHRGPLSMEETLSLLGPVIQALAQVHKAELVHRDISPDNIMVLPDGTTKLLDFGAARYVLNANAMQDRNTSTQAILKHGFAPPEQYRTHGALGPWTDVYAMCATIYYCLTGKVLPEAMSRTMDDEQIDWSGLQALTRRQRAALEKGLEIQPKDRFATMEALWQQLKPQEPKPAPKKSKKPLLITAAAVAAVAAAVGIGLLQNGGEELPEETHLVRVPETSAVTTEEPTLPVETGAIDVIPLPTTTTNVKFIYEENEAGITITGFEGEIAESLILPTNLEGKKVTAIGDRAFEDQIGLKSVMIPDGVTSIGYAAFSGCTDLNHVNISDSVTFIDGMAFFRTPWLDHQSEVFVICGDGVLLKYNGKDTSIDIPSSVKMISSAFYHNTYITKVNIPEKITMIGAQAFYGCTALGSISIPENVISIGSWAFDGCTGLRSITIPKTVTSFGCWVFNDCSGLQEISIENGVDAIRYGIFGNCVALKKVSIPESVTEIEKYAFTGCTGLTSVTIPESVMYIEHWAFEGCTGLDSVRISADCIVEEDAFPEGCKIDYYEDTPGPDSDSNEKPYREDVSLKLKYTDISISVSYSYQLMLDCGLAQTDVSWYSEHPHVAKVDERGVVTALENGNTCIFAVYGDQKVSCLVRVR